MSKILLPFRQPTLAVFKLFKKLAVNIERDAGSKPKFVFLEQPNQVLAIDQLNMRCPVSAGLSFGCSRSRARGLPHFSA